MADALQIAGAALGIAELAFKIYNELSTFIEIARNADDTVRDLRYKLQRFRKVINTVRLTAARRTSALSSGYEHREEREIWSIILESLRGWVRTLNEFKVEIESLRPRPSQDRGFG